MFFNVLLQAWALKHNAIHLTICLVACRKDLAMGSFIGRVQFSDCGDFDMEYNWDVMLAVQLNQR